MSMCVCVCMPDKTNDPPQGRPYSREKHENQGTDLDLCISPM